MIHYRLAGDDLAAFKAQNKRQLCEWFQLPDDQPLISFIGRIVGEKGVDLLPDSIRNFLNIGGQASFLVLGSGESWTENQFRNMAYHYAGRFNAVIDYNEALSHQIYAGSDFLIMPSRVEPCGLNQMYAMRYGTIPIVRSVGGLKDTVPDIGEPGGTGRGIRFDQVTTGDIGYALHRAASMYHQQPDIMQAIRERVVAVDSSWQNSIAKYLQVYRWVGAQIVPARPIATPAEIESAMHAAQPAMTEPVAHPSEVDQVATEPVKKAPVKGRTRVSKTTAPENPPAKKSPAKQKLAQTPAAGSENAGLGEAVPGNAKSSRAKSVEDAGDFKAIAKNALKPKPPTTATGEKAPAKKTTKKPDKVKKTTPKK